MTTPADKPSCDKPPKREYTHPPVVEFEAARCPHCGSVEFRPYRNAVKATLFDPGSYYMRCNNPRCDKKFFLRFF